MRRASLVPRLIGPSLIAVLFAATPGGAEEEAKPEETKEEAKPAAGPFAKDVDGVTQYIEILESKYLPADAEGKNAGVELKFDLFPAIPRGTKINFDFEYNSLPFANFDYVVKDDNRKNLTEVWKPKRRLGTGEYILVARIPLEEQTPAVQKAIEKIDGFPPKLKPWLVRCVTKPIKVGTPEDEAREAKDICAFYKMMMERLVENMGEFKDKMKDVKDGKELASGGVLDLAAFKKYVAEWRKKQGEIQKEILEFQVNEPALFEKSKTTHVNLIELGRMASKYAKKMYEDVLAHYQVAEKVNPAGHPNFDAGYRFGVNAEQLNKRMGTITTQACPDEKQEEEPKEGGEAAKTDGGGKEVEKDGKAAPEGEEPKEEPEPAKPQKTEKKKKKKKTTG